MSIKKTLSEPVKKKFIKILIEKYKKEPEILSRFFPEIFTEFERIYKNKEEPSKSRKIYLFNGITEMTKEVLIKKINKIIDKYKKEGKIEREEAIEFLEHISHLKYRSFLLDDTFVKYILNILNVELDVKKEKVQKIKDGIIDKKFTLIRGITLYLSWDYKLLQIKIDPMEIQLRDKALSIIGIGEDKYSDVAENHDKYLNEAYFH